MQDDYYLEIMRIYNGRAERIIAENIYAESTLWDRVYLSTRSFSDGSKVYFLTLVDVKQSDGGKYLCKISHTMTDGSVVEIDKDSLLVDIHSFPGHLYPQCHRVPNHGHLNEGDTLRLVCTSEKTQPLGFLCFFIIFH